MCFIVMVMSNESPDCLIRTYLHSTVWGERSGCTALTFWNFWMSLLSASWDALAKIVSKHARTSPQIMLKDISWISLRSLVKILFFIIGVIFSALADKAAWRLWRGFWKSFTWKQQPAWSYSRFPLGSRNFWVPSCAGTATEVGIPIWKVRERSRAPSQLN